MYHKHSHDATLVLIAALLAVTLSSAAQGATSSPDARPLAPAADWQPLDPATSPPARSGHTVVTLSDGNAYLFGGFVQHTGLSAAAPAAIVPDNDLWVFNDQNWEWAEINAPDPPAARAGHSATAIGDKMYVFAGLDSSYMPLGDLVVYNATSSSWSKINTPGGPAPRKNHRSTVLDGKLVVVGGMDAYDNPKNDLWIFDPSNDTWSQGASYPGVDLYDFVLTSSRDSVYVMGMGNDEVYVYTSGSAQRAGSAPTAANPSGVWRTVTTNPGPTKRFGAAGTANGGGGLAASAVEAGAKAWLWGGNDDATWDVLADTWEFDFATATWTRVADLPLALTNSAGTWLGGRILIFGGLNADSQPQSQTWLYAPAPPLQRRYLPLVLR